MGRFDDAIAQYRKALAIDPNFLNAHQGIAMAQLYQGRPEQALVEIGEIGKKARNDGERRTGMFAASVVHIDGGQLARALEDARAQYVLGEKTNDVGAMAFDKNLMGTILLEMGKPDQAKVEYEGAVELVGASDLSDEIKANARVVVHYNLARVAAAKKDFAAAQKEADEFRAGAAASKNPQQVKNAHELDGILALARKDYDKAIAELAQANQQNPQDLYRLCVAYTGKGDAAKAADYCKRAADFNVLPNVNLAWVRTKAKAASGAKG
jgi:tetratricopeptide (TPR) repeat protein